MKKNEIYRYLLDVRDQKGAGYIVLIDPDRKNDNSLDARVETANHAGVDALFVGGSLMMDGKYHQRVARIKALAEMPVIFFPGGVNQLNEHYDAMLFMSVLSGRNPHYLIGEQAIAAPIVHDLGIETIPTGYLLIDGGARSTVEFMSGTRPIPMNRPDIVVAHSLAAQYFGMKMIYLEAGSGAKTPVTTAIIEAVNDKVDVPIIVGGGLREPAQAKERVEAGADFIVTGTIIEETGGSGLMSAFAEAVHSKE
ncbi:MAG: geranylgeranylglyceryl/heptaprenylglyceryl phosphate synthase [FCB group bacterium]|nr:geranylgeranylglyceryl/heptaprenylglyceryl phosphate synthase [FCB group bacterium]